MAIMVRRRSERSSIALKLFCSKVQIQNSHEEIYMITDACTVETDEMNKSKLPTLTKGSRVCWKIINPSGQGVVRKTHWELNYACQT